MHGWDGLFDILGWAALALTPALLVVATISLARGRGDRRGMGAAGNALQEVGAILQPDRPSLLTMAEVEHDEDGDEDGGPPR